MSNFPSSLESLKRFTAGLSALPKVLGAKVAAASAPKISSAASSTFAASQDPYGIPWAPGEAGKPVTLRKTGALAREVRYVAIGTKIRVVLGVPYAKYQIGKRPVFPRQGGALPLPYVRALEEAAVSTIREELGVPR